MDQSIAIVVPVLNRPHRVRPLIQSVQEATTVPYRLLFVASPGDKDEIRELQRAGADYIVTDWPGGVPGDFARKTNLGYRSTGEPYIFTGADDLKFHPRWDTEALRQFEREGVGFVGTNDMGNPRVLRGVHSTHSLVARWYADKFGTVDSPGAIYVEHYPHEFVDDEGVETAKSRKAWAFATNSKVEHLHPHFRKAASDPLYEQSSRRLQQGRRIFQKRRSLWQGQPQRRSQVASDIAVIVATYGDDSWIKLAEERALRSVERQQLKPVDVVHYHGNNLAQARNDAARKTDAPWLCFLDADDELSTSYIRVMRNHASPQFGILNPAVQFIKPEGVQRPKLFRTRDLSQGNYLVIGSVMRADLFWAAGGFDPRWRAWEDWSLVWKIVDLGGRIRRVPQAVYKAYWREDGRNNTVEDPEGLRTEIQAEHAEWLATR